MSEWVLCAVVVDPAKAGCIPAPITAQDLSACLSLVLGSVSDGELLFELIRVELLLAQVLQLCGRC